jgi:ElaB/YqjD/DUF883 family membrane-anchored ribosome-binding protein
MIVLRKLVTLLLVFSLLFIEACNKKKPVLPPRAVAPTIAVDLPDAIPENPADETPAPAEAEATTPPPPVKTKPKKTTRTTVAGLRPPAPPDTAIAAAMPSAEITKQKENTTQIVDSTENSLKNLSRALSDEEKAMKTQIQSYLQQSRKATTDGDYERAYNLAKKAQLLADALIKK